MLQVFPSPPYCRLGFAWILADRFALFGYGPVVHRKPFGPHLAVGALSCFVSINVGWNILIEADDNP